jgi:eukaryotic-like serine/threonine-protein kinase
MPAPLMLFERSITESYYGHFRNARILAMQAVSQSRPVVSKALTGFQEVSVRTSFRPRRCLSQRHPSRPKQSHGCPQKRPRQGRAISRRVSFHSLGDVERARKLADTVSQSARLDTLVQNYCLPTIRAALKLDQRDRASAVEILRATVKYDLSTPICFFYKPVWSLDTAA